MALFLSRYRNVIVLLAVLAAQLVLLGYQVRAKGDVPLIRTWAVSAIAPFAKVLEFFRANTVGFVEDYIRLVDVKEQNRRLMNENGRLKMEVQTLRIQVETADRLEALKLLKAKTRSKTIGATILFPSTNLQAQVVYVDRGSNDGIRPNMPVVTPDGIVGKIVQVYPLNSQVLLILDQGFSAGVVSGRNRVQGTLRGDDKSTVKVRFVQSEMRVELGEIFYTSGNDRIFPKGWPVGRVSAVKEGSDGFKDITLTPFAFDRTVEEVLIITEGVHEEIPDSAATLLSDIYLGPTSPNASENSPVTAQGRSFSTEADQILERYRQHGASQGYTYGSGVVPSFLNPGLDVRGAATPPPLTSNGVVPPTTPADPNRGPSAGGGGGNGAETSTGSAPNPFRPVEPARTAPNAAPNAVPSTAPSTPGGQALPGLQANPVTPSTGLARPAGSAPTPNAPSSSTSNGGGTNGGRP